MTRPLLAMLLAPALAWAAGPDLARPTAQLAAEGGDAARDGRCGDAVPLLEEVLRRDGEHPAARPLLADCLVTLGRLDDAAAIRGGSAPDGAPTPVAGGAGRGLAARVASGELRAEPAQSLREPAAYGDVPAGPEPTQSLREPVGTSGPPPGQEPSQSLREPAAHGGMPAGSEPSQSLREPAAYGGVPAGPEPSQVLREPAAYGGVPTGPEPPQSLREPAAYGDAPTRPEPSQALREPAAYGGVSTGPEPSQALREPGVYGGAPTGPEPSQALREPEAYGVVTEDRAAQRRAANPRSGAAFEAGGQIGGPGVGGGASVGWRPASALSLQAGLSGWAGGLPPQGALIAQGEVALLPVPWRLTPRIGAGIALAVGDGVWWADGLLGTIAHARAARLTGYGLLGVRYDLRRVPLWLEWVVALAPGSDARRPVLPLPGFRLGVRLEARRR